jgi:hypothetical protein
LHRLHLLSRRRLRLRRLGSRLLPRPFRRSSLLNLFDFHPTAAAGNPDPDVQHELYLHAPTGACHGADLLFDALPAYHEHFFDADRACLPHSVFIDLVHPIKLHNHLRSAGFLVPNSAESADRWCRWALC